MKTVLIVDDAAFMRMILKNILNKNGFEIIGEAENGRIAFAKYKELRPDIVTMDLTMPEIDGIEATKEIIKFDPQAKIIMISAMGQEPMVKEAVLSGAKGFIVKPFKEDVISNAINKIL